MRLSNLLAVLFCCTFGLSSAAPEQQFPVPLSPSPVPTAQSQRRAPEFFVIIDPSHGGYDQGVNFGAKLVEKDLTLRLARELKKELEERGVPSRMLRDSDVDIALDRRAEITNEQHASLYIALHAGRIGRGVRVYAPLLANPQQPAGRFVPWDNAQSTALERSKAAAQAVAGELRKKDLPVAVLGIPVRPLNNIAIPAIAVELAPEDGVQSLENPKRQTVIASAISAAILELRARTGAHP
jgi:N-acetylmuramoyl-L-alanine amidase